MPVYEYECSDCKNTCEVIRTVEERDYPIQCDKCKNNNLKRKLSIFGTTGLDHNVLL
ncbi:MAG: zinc ribbon domain-containing protein [bacterium]|nr:zinc ribbon domain-containing protein [bacterium]